MPQYVIQPPEIVAVPVARGRRLPGPPHLLRRPQLRRPRARDGRAIRTASRRSSSPSRPTPLRDRRRGHALPADDRRTSITRSSSSSRSAPAGPTSPRPTRSTHVCGYAVGLDMTRRDLQSQAKKGASPGTWARASTSPRRSARSCRRAGPASRRQGTIELKVNGTVRQTVRPLAADLERARDDRLSLQASSASRRAT